eukprot:INCI9826.2.p1 GENE.INCI9826.2~~INCI9826.2.p1  ORF type:complete len:844 (+),score=159.11 INCI9826.2:491-3022(+)
MASNHLAAHVALEVTKLLQVVNELRQVGLDQDLPIPQIAVCGDQSSGKSSVLEAISGVAFPRGTGLVTRCATELTITPGETWRATASVNGPDCEKKTTTDPSEVGTFIKDLTDELCGDGAEFCIDKTIKIHLQGPEYTNLTLVDLPGIVRTVTGGQSDQVIDQVNALVDRYIREDRTIILAVIPANQDIATIDILQRAAKVDPSGRRTVGVLTKPDRIESGSEEEAMNILRNNSKPLALGYYMVKNRSPTELENGVTVREARQLEEEYFRTSPFQQDFASSRLGVAALQIALSKLLVEHIKSTLPQVKDEVKQLLVDSEQKLRKLGKAPPATPSGQISVVTDVLRKWQSDMLASCEGTAQRRLLPASERGQSKTQTIVRSEKIFREQFVDKVRTSKPDFDGRQNTFNVEVIEEGHFDRETYVCEDKGVVLHFDHGASEWLISPIKSEGNDKKPNEDDCLFRAKQSNDGLPCMKSAQVVAVSGKWVSGNFLHFEPPRLVAKDEHGSMYMKVTSTNTFAETTGLGDVIALEGNYVLRPPPITLNEGGRMGLLEKANKFDVVQNVHVAASSDTDVSIGHCVHMRSGAVCKVVEKCANFRASLADVVNESRGRELPGFLNFNVFTDLVHDFAMRWKPATAEFQQKVFEKVVATSACAIETQVVNAPVLARELQRNIETELEKANQQLTAKLEEQIAVECFPETENHYLYDTLKKIRKRKIAEKVENLATDKAGYVKKEAVLQLLHSGVEGRSNEQQELDDLTAYLKAYWKVASKRFIDNVAQTIHHVLTSRKTVHEIEKKVFGFAIQDTRKLQAWFSSSVEVEAKREKLEQQVARLSEADLKLQQLY